MPHPALTPEIIERLAREIRAAGGREVNFAADVAEDGVITAVRVLARGTADRVLALPGAFARGQMMLHNHPDGVLEPSQADLHVAAALHDAGVGFGIISNDGAELFVAVEVPRARVATPIDALQVVGLLGEDGPVHGVLGSYEDRPSQRDMAAYIADGYNDGGALLLEAGTGVGKSFAYLVPAIAWALENGERTVVSTATITLQEQLVTKDLPLLRTALTVGERAPSFALLKGWRNYLCLNRLKLAGEAQGSLLEPDKHDELVALIGWAARTADGSLSDLPAPPTPEVWDEVAAEADLCPRLECAHFSKCFLFAARRRAAEADVVVVNHHLLAADLAVRQATENWDEAAVLPPYQRIVLDEAHHLEDVAANHLGAQVSSRGVRRTLARLERKGKGLVPALARELAARKDHMSQASLDLVHQRLFPGVDEARQAADLLFLRLHGRLTDEPGPLRLTDDFGQDPVWAEGLAQELDRALGGFRRLKDDIETIADRLKDAEASERRDQLLGECRAICRRLEGVADALNGALRPAPGGPPRVRWLERSGRKGQDVACAAVPLDLAPVLKALLFDKVRTAVLTSATLAAGGDFTFLKRRLGLAEEPSPVTVQEVLPSPFDFGSQCLFGIPEDVPDPREDPAGHAAMVTEVVRDLAHAADGGMFVLFTSHAALRDAAQRVRQMLGERWPILVQGEGNRDALLRRFREAGNAILLGTDTFWEGVDVPGRALRALVLTKLPFKVPSEPITAARLERLAEQGEDGFFSYLLPHAALKLKQGFGRLIRSRADVGAVVLLDPRVLKRRYGPMILDGLPRADQVTGSWRHVRTKVEDFFARHGVGAGEAR
ncbi:MAG TPA: helicase C-terminal domain-containing protein [Gemmatimonadales bacterium]|nr:helicase C-terminal domain-containing protein [Gemmatimonadales bacterium]